MTAANAKAAHYDAVLGAALLQGQWASAAPGAAPNGTALSWGELVRKWGKHTGGNTALVHHLRDISLLYLSSTSDLTTSTSGYLNLSASLHADAAADDAGPNSPPSGDSNASGASGHSGASGATGTTGTTGSFIHIPHPHLHRSKEGAADAATDPAAGRAVAQRASFLSVDLDGDGEAHVVTGERADEVADGLRAVQEAAKQKLSEGAVQSAKLLLAFHHHAIGDYAAALDVYKTVDWASATAGAVAGDAAVCDRIRGRTLQGLSYELSQQSSEALESYLATIPLLAQLSTSPLVSPSYLAKSTSPRGFDNYRELLRYLTTALTRAARLSAMTTEATQTLRILRTFHALPPAPATFRTAQRRSMVFLYLRALLTRPEAGPAAEPYLLPGAPFSAGARSARAVWQAEVGEAFRIGQRLLGETTKFPRAGQVNAPVVAFIELVVAFHAAHPPLVGNILDVLYWATGLTFQSHSVLRHFVRLLAARRDLAEARRTFELYVELVLKARQTAQPDVSLQLKRRPTDDVPAGPTKIREQAEQAESAEAGGTATPRETRDDADVREERRAQTAEAEMDTDECFVETLVDGARLLIRELGEPDEAWRYATLAGEVIATVGNAASVLRARVEECKGVVRMAMANTSAQNEMRPVYQAQAIDHLVSATRLNPTSASAYYHLAYAHAEARAIDPALAAIRASLELDSDSVPAWHLLALLLTAKADFADALKACEAGVAVWDAADQADDADGDDAAAALPDDPGVESRDFAVVTPTPAPAGGPAAAEPLLLASGDIRPPPTRAAPKPRSERLTDVLQIRSTANFVLEKVAGQEAAMLGKQELFAFFSARTGKREAAVAESASMRAVTRAGSLRSAAGKSARIVSAAASLRLDDYVNVDRESGASPPVGEQDAASSAGAGATGPELAPPITTTTASSPGSSSPAESLAGDAADAEKDRASLGAGHGRSRKSSGGRGLIKGLHVPSVGGLRSARQSEANLGMHHTMTASSSALSLAPTAVYSNYASRAPSVAPTRAPSPPTPPPGTNTAPAPLTPAESRVLSDLWLSTAATFRRWGKLEQALVAVEEAESLDPENPSIWAQLGLYYVAMGEAEAALPAFTKCLLLRPDYAPAVVGLAKLYMAADAAVTRAPGAPAAEVSTAGDGAAGGAAEPPATAAAPAARAGAGTELAHSLLSQLTRGRGWDAPDAWFVLGQACARLGQPARARECWVHALRLDESRVWGERGLEGVARWL